MLCVDVCPKAVGVVGAKPFHIVVVGEELAGWVLVLCPYNVMGLDIVAPYELGTTTKTCRVAYQKWFPVKRGRHRQCRSPRWQ